MNNYRQHASLTSPVPERIEEESLGDKIRVVAAFVLAIAACALFCTLG